jgi:hypothetical protein
MGGRRLIGKDVANSFVELYFEVGMQNGRHKPDRGRWIVNGSKVQHDGTDGIFDRDVDQIPIE